MYPTEYLGPITFKNSQIWAVQKTRNITWHQDTTVVYRRKNTQIVMFFQGAHLLDMLIIREIAWMFRISREISGGLDHEFEVTNLTS